MRICKRLALSLLTLSSIFLLQGCINNPRSGNLSTPAGPVNIRPQAPTLAQANHLLVTGRKSEAVDAYYQAAFSFHSPQRERILIQSVELAASINEINKARTYLTRINHNTLEPAQSHRHQYVKSLIALQEGNHAAAQAMLPKPVPGMPKDLYRKIALVKKQVAPHVTTTPAELETKEVEAAPKKVATNPTPMVPITTAQPRPGVVGRGFVPRAVNSIAVLLPNTGVLGKVGEEIFQGIQAAAARQPNRPSIKRYNVTPNTVTGQYQKAVAEGASIVLGPLNKQGLQTLMSNPALITTPVISLNSLPNQQPGPGTLYQFGLSPEDEARQVAQEMLARGHKNVLVLVPNSRWGNKLGHAFRQTLLARGGRILSQQRFNPKDIKSYLSSIQTGLEAGQPEAVFIAASPTQARYLAPILRDQAQEAKVFATSHIFSGRSEPNKDIDLDGIIYTETPFVLNPGNSERLTTLQYPRLYAMGNDAVLIATSLDGLNSRRRISGQTGQIALSPRRTIVRQLPLATFKDGKPQSLGL